MKGPVLVHVVTKKGKGYRFAEENPQKFHGTVPFNVDTGQSLPGNGRKTYTEVFGQTLVKLAEEDPRLVAITAAMAEGTGLSAFAARFPERFYDVGIAEQHALTFAAGLATAGMTPVVAIYSTFLQRAYDQVLHDVCLQKLPVVMVLDRGGIVGADGPTHHGLFDLSFLRCIPHLVLMAPKDENELRHMLKTAIRLQGPVAIRYPRGKALGVKLDEELTPLNVGSAEILLEGGEVAILALGASVTPALEAAGILAGKGISASVVNARFVKPLDEALILSLVQTHPCLVTVEENVLAGGFGSAVLELLSCRGISKVRTKRIGVPDEFVEHASQEELRRQYGLDREGIARTILDFLGKADRPAT
jgi:1-deoxy-D-xylulose-5-phosphate synthase